MANEKIMIVDDDVNICELLRLYLEKEGFTTVILNNGQDAVESFNSVKPDLVLLDIMLPGLDGWQVCRKIRSVSSTPVIMLTAKGETFDKVLGLELGADDYIVKPFDTKEVLARIKAVLRRVSTQTTEQIKEVRYDKLVINLTNYELRVNGVQIDTPPKELELIYHLASNPNRVFTRDQLLDEVWGFDYYGDSRTVDVHVKRLREKLEGVSDQWELKTVWSVGYKFETKEPPITG
ncbi:MAG: response regulator transcription factor [Clostridiales bacterium]|jgi:DNA-binding response OmpR family regulator|nr:response regulator transcription factor [Clostridiales bacterium]HOJ35138.1 response regulator transcription factor [Clostridiales bacterium]HQD72626.1 response regulator transcription factor [Clostridiales bacterium]